MDKGIFTSGETIPEDLDYAYIIGRDGFYLFKRTALFEAVVKVDKIPLLDEEKETATLLAPKIPYPLIAEALAFFRAVFEKYRSEAMVFLLFENNAWSIEPGAQEVASASVSYENALHKSGKRPAGTIHSHCNMGASFSGIDDGDDMHSDGVHITIGKISEEFPEIACSLAVNGSRFHNAEFPACLKPQESIKDMVFSFVFIDAERRDKTYRLNTGQNFTESSVFFEVDVALPERNEVFNLNVFSLNHGFVAHTASLFFRFTLRMPPFPGVGFDIF
jgi:hypothetical protein